MNLRNKYCNCIGVQNLNWLTFAFWSLIIKNLITLLYDCLWYVWENWNNSFILFSCDVICYRHTWCISPMWIKEYSIVCQEPLKHLLQVYNAWLTITWTKDFQKSMVLSLYVNLTNFDLLAFLSHVMFLLIVHSISYKDEYFPEISAPSAHVSGSQL